MWADTVPPAVAVCGHSREGASSFSRAVVSLEVEAHDGRVGRQGRRIRGRRRRVDEAQIADALAPAGLDSIAFDFRRRARGADAVFHGHHRAVVAAFAADRAAAAAVVDVRRVAAGRRCHPPKNQGDGEQGLVHLEHHGTPPPVQGMDCLSQLERRKYRGYTFFFPVFPPAN